MRTIGLGRAFSPPRLCDGWRVAVALGRALLRLPHYVRRCISMHAHPFDSMGCTVSILHRRRVCPPSPSIPVVLGVVHLCVPVWFSFTWGRLDSSSSVCLSPPPKPCRVGWDPTLWRWTWCGATCTTRLDATVHSLVGRHGQLADPSERGVERKEQQGTCDDVEEEERRGPIHPVERDDPSNHRRR